MSNQMIKYWICDICLRQRLFEHITITINIVAPSNHVHIQQPKWHDTCICIFCLFRKFRKQSLEIKSL